MKLCKACIIHEQNYLVAVEADKFRPHLLVYLYSIIKMQKAN